DDRDGDVVIMRGQLVRFAASAASREHFQLGAEHVAFRQRDVLALGPAILAALDVERGSLVQQVRGVPGAEVDLVMHQALRAEHAYGKDAGRGPAGTDVPQLAVREPER